MVISEQALSATSSKSILVGQEATRRYYEDQFDEPEKKTSFKSRLDSLGNHTSKDSIRDDHSSHSTTTTLSKIRTVEVL